ncbi:MAG: SpoIIE family protein phosphatase [Phycisphaeraceae bacterium]|nr:SpoIIE family protein phosphatase [Phycisphaeraceae bacterium]
MKPEHEHTPPLTLRVAQTFAPEVRPDSEFRVDADSATLGRSLDAEVCLPDAAVSRSHARFTRRAGHWFVTDLASRTGTLLNGAPLQPGLSMPIHASDMLTFGATALRVELPRPHRPGLDDDLDAPTTVETVADLGGAITRARTGSVSLAARLLELLIAASRELQSDDDAHDVHATLLRSALSATRCRHAFLLRTDDAVERVEAVAVPPGVEASSIRPSRTLLRRAIDERGPVLLSSQRTAELSRTLAEHGAVGALCTPVGPGASGWTLLYLESHESDPPLREEAAEVCVALASLAAGALERVRQRELAARREQMERDLLAAREVQNLIFPPRKASIPPIRYASSIRPGAFLAGDLFDAFPLPDGRAAVFLGDVTGEGVDAAVIMASAEAALHATLLETLDPTRAVERVNAYLAERSPLDRFVSLWLGIFDARDRSVVYVDAGHGHWIIKDGADERRPGATGIPLGIDGATHYPAQRVTLAPGARIVLYSDGMTEQRSRDGEMFGPARLAQSLHPSPGVDDDVRLACDALELFAETASWDDDASIASITWSA